MKKRSLPSKRNCLTFNFEDKLYIVDIKYFNTATNKSPLKRAIQLGKMYIQDSLPDFGWKRLENLDGIEILWVGEAL